MTKHSFEKETARRGEPTMKGTDQPPVERQVISYEEYVAIVRQTIDSLRAAASEHQRNAGELLDQVAYLLQQLDELKEKSDVSYFQFFNDETGVGYTENLKPTMGFKTKSSLQK